MRNLLNHEYNLPTDTAKSWRTFNPSNYGLTGSKEGVWNKHVKVLYWHEAYAVEMAHEEFNKRGCVTYRREVIEN
jgi:hypothetical protein